MVISGNRIDRYDYLDYNKPKEVIALKIADNFPKFVVSMDEVDLSQRDHSYEYQRLFTGRVVMSGLMIPCRRKEEGDKI